MNKIFKTVYNEVIGSWVAVSEITKTGGKKSKSSKTALAALTLGMISVWGGVASGQTSPDHQPGITLNSQELTLPNIWVETEDGDGSIAENDALGSTSNNTVFGVSNTVDIQNSVIYGVGNKIHKDTDIPDVFHGPAHLYLMGNGNDISQSDNSVIGNFNQLIGDLNNTAQVPFRGFNMVYGDSNKLATQRFSLVFGNSNQIYGADNSRIYGNNNILDIRRNSSRGFTPDNHAYTYYDELNVYGGNNYTNLSETEIFGSSNYVGSANNTTKVEEFPLLGREFNKVITKLKETEEKIKLVFPQYTASAANGSFVFGSKNILVSSSGNVLTGTDNTVYGTSKNNVYGSNNLVFSKGYASIFGVGNKYQGGKNWSHKSQLFGEDNTVAGYYNTVFGSDNVINEDVKTIFNTNLAGNPQGGNVSRFKSFSEYESNNNVVIGKSNYSRGSTNSIIGQNNAIGYISNPVGGTPQFESIVKQKLPSYKYVNILGKQNLVNANYSNSIGSQNNINGDYSLSIGNNNTITNSEAIAIGNKNLSSGEKSISIGKEAKATGAYTVAIGFQSEAKFQTASALGYLSDARTLDSVAIGFDATSSGTRGVTLGAYTVAGTDSATAVGPYAKAWGPASSSFGTYAFSRGYHSVAIGSRANTFGNAAIALGHNSKAVDTNATAIGHGAKALVWNSTAVGDIAEAWGESSLALGRNSKSFVAHAFSAGDANAVDGRYGGAFGYANKIYNHASFGFGSVNKVHSFSSMSLGTNNEITAQADRTFVLGRHITANHKNSVILGNRSSSKEASSVTGASIDGIAVTGFIAGNAEYGVVSVGSAVGTEIFNSDSLLKSANSVSDKYKNQKNLVEYYSKVTQKQQELIQSKLAAEEDATDERKNEIIRSVSREDAINALRDAGIEEPEWIAKLTAEELAAVRNIGPRQIVNVAAGAVSANSTDAINGSQLFAVADTIIKEGVDINGNSGTAQTIKIGQTINVKGKTALTDNLTDEGENIATKVDANGILIRLKKQLTNLQSLTLVGNNKFDVNGLTLSGGVKVLKTGINAGNKKITGVATPEADGDAVNLAYLNDTVDELTNGGFKYEGNTGGEKTVKLGGKISIKGTAAWDSTDQGANISTYSATDGQLLIGLSKVLTGLTSAQFGDTTINGSGVTITGGPSLTKDGGLNANNKPITNIKPASDKSPVNDAANVGYVQAEIDELKALGYKLSDGTNTSDAIALGKTLSFTGDDNITTTASNDGVAFALKKTLTGLTSIAIENGPTLNADGLAFPNSGPSFGPNGLTVDTVVINNDGINAGGKKITGVADPSEDTDAANKQYVDKEVGELGDKALTFGSNIADASGTKTIKLKDGGTLNIKGADSNTDKSKFDDANIMTWLDGDTMRIGLNKELKLDSLKAQDPNNPNKTAEVKPDSIVFNGVDGKNGEDGKVVIKVKTDEPKDINDAPIDRITVNDNPLATLLDGFKFSGNDGKNIAITLNKVITIQGADLNSTWAQFDSGNNVMTKAEKDGDNIKYTVALKKSPEFESLTLTGTPADADAGTDAKPGKLTIQDGKMMDKIVASVSENEDTKGDPRIILNGRENDEIAKLGADEHGHGDFRLNDKNGDRRVVLGVNEISTDPANPDAPKKTAGELKIKNAENANVITASVDAEGDGHIKVTNGDTSKYSEIEHDGFAINDGVGTSKLGTKKDGTGGVENPETKKRRLTHTVSGPGVDTPVVEEVATLEDGLIFKDNTTNGKAAVKLNNSVRIAGAAGNNKWEDFDGGENIMTKIEDGPGGEKIIRIAMKKDLKLTNGEFGGPNEDGTDGEDGNITVTSGDGDSTVEIKPDVIIFKGVDGKPGENGQPGEKGDAGITMTLNGKPGVDGEDGITRIILTDKDGNEVDQGATLKDGFLFGANAGDGDPEKNPVANTLNSRVNISGHKDNTKWDEFDEGSNIMTKVTQDPDTKETTITVAMKKDLALDNLTIGKDGKDGQPGKDGKVEIINKDGEKTIVINAAKDPEDPNSKGPEIAVKDPSNGDGSKLTPGGLEITKKPEGSDDPSTSLISVEPKGEPGLGDEPDSTKPRITLTTGKGENAVKESIATLNDGLGFKGDGDKVINKKLNNTLDIVGGEKDETKLSTTKDKNIGVIVEEQGEGSDKKQVLAVRLAKNLKGLQSAEFKPLDKDGNDSGKSINIDSNGVTVAKGDDKATFDERGLKVGENGPQFTKDGISAAGLIINDVAPGVKPTDAAQFGQVSDMLAATKRELKGDIEKRYQDASAGTASAIAVASLPQAYEPGQSVVGIAGGTHEGHTALSVGVSSVSDNGKWILKGNVTGNGRGQISAGVGAGYAWK
ncbi:ESPR-type extended signal peptide-containing protein [Taylorella asinigenitalis]|uniref:Autotransporter adhesin n=1 Tax=Taylorella asinigenitalis (strain MCE3) TaxID=1008459 RepID=G4QBR2_TAYAM|nr:YadA-like family protein [Taylorella asinigenitalis]AEP37257.1 hypothetical protein TASI_1519 [Taylorella asinigenitalis MCE3]